MQNVADVIIEEDINRRPNDPSPFNQWGFFSAENKDHDERVRLPRLRAMDAYFMYNRNGHYYVAD